MKRPEPDDYQFGSIEDLPLFRRAPEAGPFADSNARRAPEEVLIASLIWKHKGFRNPITIARLHEMTGFSERKIKSVVEQLIVTHRMKIGGNRQEPFGYFIAQNDEDLRAAVEPYKSQMIAMAKRVRVLDAPHSRRELLGQIRIELEGE
jgi:hypothetical protein